MSDNFWTEDNVTDALMQFGYKMAMQRDIGITEFIKEFKKQKLQSNNNQDWEILSFERIDSGEIYKVYSQDKPTCVAGGGTIGYHLKSANYKIHSVKVLSSGEIFSVGDELEDMEGDNIIDAFWLDYHGNAVWISTNQRKQYGVSLEIAKKKVKKPILFTTTDNVNIYEGDTFAIVELPSYNVAKSLALQGTTTHPNQLYFSTYEKANEYVVYNKPILNLKECMDAMGAYKLWNPIQRLKELVKQKINQ